MVKYRFNPYRGGINVPVTEPNPPQGGLGEIPPGPEEIYKVGSYQVFVYPDGHSEPTTKFYPGEPYLGRIAGAGNPGIWDEIWDWIKDNIWDFLSSGKVGVDPKVLQAIQKVEAECGMSENLEWSYAWYDRRFPKPLGNTWKGYVHYASQSAIFPWDKQHYFNCATHCLNELQKYLQAALSECAGKPIGGIMDWLKKNAGYVAMGGGVLALVIALVARGRAPVYILPERK